MTGLTGLTGATGPAGPTGLAGPTGPTGPPGADGAQGLQGASGLQGAKGDAGDKGDKGETGDTGHPGAKGDTGEPGLPGAKGDAGDPGVPGAKGDTGGKGDTGPAGANGTDGLRGDVGPAGAEGPVGPAGPQGPVGPQGPAGGLVYPAIVDINPVPRPSASHLWNDVFVNDSAWNNVYRRSYPDGDSSSYIEWKVPLGAGTWDIEATVITTDDAGIMTFSLDGNDVGSVDGYDALPTAFNVRKEINGVDVATSGIHTLRISTATKNINSYGYFGYLVWVRLVQR